MNPLRNLVIGVSVLILAAGGFWIYKDTRQKPQDNFINQIDRKLTAEDRKIFEDRLVLADQYIADAKDDQAKFDALFYKGAQLQALGKLAEARDVFLIAANVEPENYNIYVSLYLVFLDMTDYKSAETNIKKSIEKKSVNADAWKRYILLEVEKFQMPDVEIRKLYAQALQQAQPNIDVITDYAVYLEKVGDLEGAKEYWQKAIEAYPVNKVLYQQEIERLEKKTQ